MSTRLKLMQEFCEVIESYGGRDKVMKVLCYSAKLIAGLHAKRDPDLYKRFAIVSSRISGARATLRLIDDIPMLQYAIEYGLGAKEPDRLLAFLGVTANFVDLLYYPVEKICWLSEHNVITVRNADNWDVLNSVLWVVSVYLNLMSTLRNFSLNQQKLQCSANLVSPPLVTDKAHKKQTIEMLSIIRLALDFTHAVSTLPSGYLWGGKLSTWQVGAVGTISASLGIYQIFAKRNLNRIS